MRMTTRSRHSAHRHRHRRRPCPAALSVRRITTRCRPGIAFAPRTGTAEQRHDVRARGPDGFAALSWNSRLLLTAHCRVAFGWDEARPAPLSVEPNCVSRKLFLELVTNMGDKARPRKLRPASSSPRRRHPAEQPRLGRGAKRFRAGSCHIAKHRVGTDSPTRFLQSAGLAMNAAMSRLTSPPRPTFSPIFSQLGLTSLWKFSPCRFLGHR